MATRRVARSRTNTNNMAPRVAVVDTQPSPESNIQVVVRCRRRSQHEIADNSPIIVTSAGAKSSHVTIQTSPPLSSLGVVTLPPTKTYPFDSVFGPEADQAIIYHDVVAPMLHEVLHGYNCTLFAYGQTGTGKTYTMQGDLTPTPMGNPSAQAGMIPRVLFRLFHELDATTTDYSVKISFVELYNEELRDLLAADLPAPAGSVQPMGMGNSSKEASNQAGLKIFDDSSKKGVFIQGLEDIPVKDAHDALALLAKGSHRRQIAATKFNDHSSRSHSVFSVTVHIKETSNLGDDLLKVGKLNLVDLAGSENIGRSGAESKRAREAGMINQSLLTLGRVINALVEKGQHVPYRESKLTRLLQDSLGGHTKTCIIATISPARSNMEETLSTLDYAIRAKSISNKPEVNQRMTRNALLKEYVAEIERLKADVLAAREQDGIYFSRETWNQLNAEQEMTKTEMEEARMQVEIVESQMRAVRDEFEQSMALLMRRDGELKDAKERLTATEGELGLKVGELGQVKGMLEEEIVVRKAHAKTEGALDSVATGLKHIATESVSDVGGLFEKLERKTTVFSQNSKAVVNHGKTIASENKALTSKLDDFVKTCTLHLQRLRSEAKQFQMKEVDALSTQSERIERQLRRVQECVQIIQTKDDSSTQAINTIQTLIKEMHENFKNDFVAWSESLRQYLKKSYDDLENSSSAGFVAVEEGLKAMGNLLESTIHESREFIEAERKSAVETMTLASAAASAEITRLRQENVLLMQLLESEKAKGERAKNELIHQVSGLLSDFTAERDRGLKEAVEEIRVGNGKAEKDMSAFITSHSGIVDGIVEHGGKVGQIFEKRGGEGKRTRDGALKALGSSKATFNGSLADLQTSMGTSITTYSNQVQGQTRTMSSTCTDAFEKHARAKRARVEATIAMSTEVQSEYRHLQRGIASTSRNVEDFTGRAVSESTSLTSTTESYNKAATSNLSSMRRATRSLAEQGTQEDMPTGRTPRKRVWHYVDQWELTKDRDTVLKGWREQDGLRGEFTSDDSLLLGNKEQDNGLEMVVDDMETPESNMVSPTDSPLAASLASIASSTSIPVPRPELKKSVGSLKSGLPALGTLTDRPTNVLMGRGSRRVR